MENKSEVARILTQIAQEYESAQNGLYGPAQGSARHSFITARMENMAKLHVELEKLVGDQASGLVATRLDQIDDPRLAIITTQLRKTCEYTIDLSFKERLRVECWEMVR